jgi:hypothetical protein
VVVISTIGLLQGMDVGHIKSKLQKELFDVVITGWKVCGFIGPDSVGNFFRPKL